MTMRAFFPAALFLGTAIGLAPGVAMAAPGYCSAALANGQVVASDRIVADPADRDTVRDAFGRYLADQGFQLTAGQIYCLISEDPQLVHDRAAYDERNAPDFQWIGWSYAPRSTMMGGEEEGQWDAGSAAESAPMSPAPAPVPTEEEAPDPSAPQSVIGRIDLPPSHIEEPMPAPTEGTNGVELPDFRFGDQGADADEAVESDAAAPDAAMSEAEPEEEVDDPNQPPYDPEADRAAAAAVNAQEAARASDLTARNKAEKERFARQKAEYDARLAQVQDARTQYEQAMTQHEMDVNRAQAERRAYEAAVAAYESRYGPYDPNAPR